MLVKSVFNYKIKHVFKNTIKWEISFWNADLNKNGLSLFLKSLSVVTAQSDGCSMEPVRQK